MTTERGKSTQKARSMRVACVQIDSKNGEIDRNRDKVRELTKDLQRGEVDLIILPEMALSGYIFDSTKQIAPFLEDPNKGERYSPSLSLAKELAIRLDCYVCIGLPCIGSTFSTKAQLADQIPFQITTPFDARMNEFRPTNWPEPLAFNSSLFVDQKGKIVHIFRKHFNFTNDKVWATEGPGFECIKDVPLFGNVCVAICMDLNPYDFQAPFEDYELARFCQKEKVDTILMNIAWLAPDQDENENENENEKEEEEDEGTGHPSKEEQLKTEQFQHMNYLVQRLSPLLDSQDGQQSLQPLRFIACNRVGTEAGTLFAGTSFGMRFYPGSNPSVRGYMGREEGMKIIEL